MQDKEGWPERVGMIIGPTVIFGIMCAIAGLIWCLALGFNIGTGALWGGIVGAAIVFILTLGLSRKAIKGMGLIFGGMWGIAVVIGLIVWLIRALVG